MPGFTTSITAGTLGPITLEHNWLVTWGYAVLVPSDFGGPQEVFTEANWYRMAPSLTQPSGNVNRPGTSVSIATADNASGGRYGEAVIVDGHGNPYPALTVLNTSHLTGGGDNLASVTFNWVAVFAGDPGQ